MSKTINIGSTDSGTAIALDIDILRTSHLLVQGASGSGKSYTLRKIAEEAVPQIQTIIIDPEGEYHTLREKFPFVLVGKGGETPASIATAALLARRLIETGASAICDLYAMEREDRQEWVAEFFTALMSLPRELWRPLLVIVDESHLFAPERNQSKDCLSRGAMEDLCSRGRKRGIGIVLATQRITKVSNNCVSECQNYLIGRTFMPDDRERAAKALGISSKADKNDFYADLKVLERGQFWGLGVAIAMERTRVSIGRTVTTHPQPGETEAHRPPTPDQVRALLPQLADLPQEVADGEAGNEALEHLLQDAIRERDEALAKVPDYPDLRPEVDRLKKLISLFGQRIEIVSGYTEKCRMDLQGIQVDAEASIATMPIEQVRQIASRPFDFESSPTNLETVDAQCELDRRSSLAYLNPNVQPAQSVQNVTKDTSSQNGHSPISSATRRLLEVLVEWHPKGMTYARLAANVGLKPRGGHWGTRIRELKGAEFICEQNGAVFATDAGVKYIGKVRRPAPKTTSEVLDLWQTKLSQGAAKMLMYLVQHRGKAVAKDVLGTSLGIVPRGGYWGGCIAELHSAGLVVKHGGGALAASKENLFL